MFSFYAVQKLISDLGRLIFEIPELHTQLDVYGSECVISLSQEPLPAQHTTNARDI